ncbi:hypothetical protein HQ535_11535, partial [bacterium]|nr:hypothetical protein [bacterium]
MYPIPVPTSGLWEVASGIDSLYWSIKGDLPAVELERLEAARRMAEDAGEDVTFELGGEEFQLQPFGFMGRYRFHLVHPHGRIGVTPSKRFPTVYIQPDAEFLHGVGPEMCAGWFNNVVSSLVPGGTPKVSRVDLFMDVQGWAPTPEMRDRFVTRATHRRLYEDEAEMNMLQFGKRGNGLYARIYNKSTETQKKGSVWWHDLWGERWRPEEDVWRIEAEIRREVLGQLGIDTLDDLFANVGGAWGYITEWLSLRIPSEDKTRSRWQIDPAWEAVSQASLRNGAAGLERTYDAKRRAKLRPIIVGMRGYISSYAALIGEVDIGEIGPCLTSVLYEWEMEEGVPFSSQVIYKRRKYGL